ncbi:MAG: ATP-binding protein [Pseudomonadota bacterium]
MKRQKCRQSILARRAIMAYAALPLLGSAAYAQGQKSTQTSIDLPVEQAAFLDITSLDAFANSAVMFPIFMGAFAFAMWSATWLIRERRQLDQRQGELALENADLRSRYERAQALLNIPDQRIVIWDGREEGPLCRGSLPPIAGTPEQESAFVAFGTWMTALSAQAFEQSVERLRKHAEAFDLTVESKGGGLLEAQGRASGSHAFVRFISLSGDRAALAALESQHTRLIQTTETMKSLLEAVPFPVWLRSKEGRLTWANGAYVDAVDGTSLEAVSAHDLHLLDQSERDSLNRRHEIPLEDDAKLHGIGSGSVQPVRQRIPATVRGDRRTLDVSEILGEEGYAGIAVDMSEVEEARSNLRRALEGHTDTLNQLATAVAIFDEKQNLSFTNRAFDELWGLKDLKVQRDIANGHLFDVLREAGRIADQPDWSKWRNTLLEVYGQKDLTEDWWYLPDGRTLRVVATPHKQGGVTWVFENITEQLALESRFIELTKVQGETLDQLVEAICVFSPNGRLKLSNPAFQTLWRLGDEDVAAETPIDVLAERCNALSEDNEFWQTITNHITGALDHRKPLDGRMTLPTNTVLDYALVPLPNGQSMLSFADVSASVSLEQTLTERNEALEAAERLKNAFIEHVSYEFRAPLTSIKGFAETLQARVFGPLNDKQTEYVDHIASSSAVLQALVDNLLDLATVDAGIMELDLEPVSLQSAIHTAARSVAEHLQEQGVKLSLKAEASNGTSAEPSTFIADSTRVQQVLFNLLNNAINFSPEGSSIVLESASDAESVTISITDSGPGIPQEARESLFDRFRGRAGDGRRGAGLGLAIARSMVQLHGGSLELDTTHSNGARFICKFPKAGANTVSASSVAAE